MSKSNRVVKYRDGFGYYWAVLLPEMLDPDDGESGVFLGPPEELMSLPLDNDAIKVLFEKLVDGQMYIAPQLMNRRVDLHNILQSLGVPKSEVNSIVRRILQIYQVEYYGE